MLNFINIHSTVSDDLDKIFFTVEYPNDKKQIAVSIKDYVCFLQQAGVIDDFNLEEEEVMLDRYNFTGFSDEETLVVDRRNCFDFINETLSEVRTQVFELLVKKIIDDKTVQTVQESEDRLEQIETIFEAFGCSLERDEDLISVVVKKSSEGDLQFIMTAKFPAVMTPDPTKVFINDIDLQSKQTVISGTFVA